MVMTAIDTFAIASRTTLPALRRNPPRVEKVRYANGLDGEQTASQQHPPKNAPCNDERVLSRNETVQDATDWNAVRLVPAFVTQVLAQVLTEGAEPPLSALQAYVRDTHIPAALVYDRDA